MPRRCDGVIDEPLRGEAVADEGRRRWKRRAHENKTSRAPNRRASSAGGWCSRRSAPCGILAATVDAPAPAPVPGSRDSTRARAIDTWLNRAAVVNGVLFVSFGSIGLLLSTFGHDDLIPNIVVVVTAITGLLFLLAPLVLRRSGRALNLALRRDAAALGRSSELIVKPVAPSVYAYPVVDSPETARLKAEHDRQLPRLRPAIVVAGGCTVLLFTGLGGGLAAMTFLAGWVLSVGFIAWRILGDWQTTAALARQTALDVEAHRQRLIGETSRERSAPVLYLRSFADDERAGRRHGELTEEEHLVKALAWIGPLVAVGRPGEELPRVGAQRIYISDDVWQARVTELMATARLVVLRTGTGEGFNWEIAHAVATLPPERFLLVVDHRRELRQVLDAIAKGTGSQAPSRRPRLPGRRIGSVKGLVTFSADWAPQAMPLKRLLFRASDESGRLVSRFTLSLAPLFERLGVQFERPRLSGAKIILAVILLAYLVLVAVAEYLDL